jgi:putative phosphoesterase
VPTKIRLISDVHATVAPLEEALSIFQHEGVDEILCAGDIAGYGEELGQTIELLVESNCKVILGNHDLWFLNTLIGEEKNIGAFFRSLPVFLEFKRDQKQLYAVHASPPFSQTKGITLLNENEEILEVQKEQWVTYLKGFCYDILIIGHTHQVFVEQLGGTLVINPGSTKFNHTCFILDLPGMDIRMFSLSNKTPVKAWNWGMSS